MNRFTRCALLLITLTCASTACVDPEPASTQNDDKSWMLGGDEQDMPVTQDMSLADMSDSPDAGPISVDMPGFIDMPALVDMPAVETDAGPPEDMVVQPDDAGAPDMFAPDMPVTDAGSPDMGNNGMEGEGCGNSNECTSGLVCCPSPNGQYSCTAEASCFTGGVCEIDDDCPGVQECCDFSQFGVSNVCRDRCRGGGGMMGGGCMNNSECSNAGEVCCPSFQGAAMCVASSQCQTGGSCATDADCLNGKLCCDFFGQAALCLDQCPF